MNKNMKKVAIALLATNVIASTVLTALPPVQTHAAENKLMSTVNASQDNLINTVRDGDTKITGKVPGGAQLVEVSLWEHADYPSDPVYALKRYAARVQSDSNGNYSITPGDLTPVDLAGPYTSSSFKYAFRAYPFSVKITTGNSLTAETSIQQSKNTANTGYINPVKVGDKEITGHLDNRPSQPITFREMGAWTFGTTTPTPQRVAYTSTDANGNFKFTLGTGIQYARLTVESSLEILLNTIPGVNETSIYVPTSLTVDTSAINAARGTTGKITASITPAAADQALTYTSSNSNIITVDASGSWQAKATGTATITVTPNANTGLAKTISVTVTANAADVAQTAVNDLFISDNPANHIKDTTTQAKVDAVTDATKKAELQTYVDKAQTELNARTAEAERVAAATTSVNDLFLSDNPANHIKDTTTQAKIDAAQTKVDAVTDTTKKAELQTYVDKAQTELDDKKHGESKMSM
ncbi:hypothetical protein PGRAN_13213, partial [Listeria grandensis FSL F6-0971]